MRTESDKEERREFHAERNRKVLVGIGVAIVLLSVMSTLLISIRAYQASDNHHNTTTALLTEHSGELKEVDTLSHQVAKVIDGLPPADRQLVSEAVVLNYNLLQICHAVGATCESTPAP